MPFTLDSVVQMAMLMALAMPRTSAATYDTFLSSFHQVDGVAFGPSIIAVLAIAIGAAVSMAGYRLFRPTVFLCGFIVGGISISSVVVYLSKTGPSLMTASSIAFMVGGLLVGGLALTLYRTSLFITGATSGVLLACVAHTTVLYKIHPDDPNTVLVVAAVACGVVGGILAMRLEKPVLIGATSVVGAITEVWGAGYFIGDFPNAAYLQRDALTSTIVIPAVWWGYLVAIFVLCGLGVMVQLGKTGRTGEFHKPDFDPKTSIYKDLFTPTSDVHRLDGNPRNINAGSVV